MSFFVFSVCVCGYWRAVLSLGQGSMILFLLFRLLLSSRHQSVCSSYVVATFGLFLLRARYVLDVSD